MAEKEKRTQLQLTGGRLDDVHGQQSQAGARAVFFEAFERAYPTAILKLLALAPLYRDHFERYPHWYWSRLSSLGGLGILQQEDLEREHPLSRKLEAWLLRWRLPYSWDAEKCCRHPLPWCWDWALREVWHWANSGERLPRHLLMMSSVEIVSGTADEPKPPKATPELESRECYLAAAGRYYDRVVELARQRGAGQDQQRRFLTPQPFDLLVRYLRPRATMESVSQRARTIRTTLVPDALGRQYKRTTQPTIQAVGQQLKKTAAAIGLDLNDVQAAKKAKLD